METETEIDVEIEDLLRHAVREAEAQGARHAEAYAAASAESEVFIENSDLKQAKSQESISLGIRVILGAGSLGFYSTNRLAGGNGKDDSRNGNSKSVSSSHNGRERIKEAVSMAIKVARVSPEDRFNALPNSRARVHLLRGIYDKKAESFRAQDAAEAALEMLDAARSFDSRGRVSVDSGNFTAVMLTHALANSNGMHARERISAFSWSLMGMAVDGAEVSSFDVQSGGTHFVKGIDVRSAALEFAETVVSSLGSRKADSFQGEMLLAPSAALELVEDVIAHSVSSDSVQKKSSHFAGKLGRPVASELLSVEDDATNVEALGASSFDREGVAHRRNTVIEKGVLKKFLYNTYTARKDGVRSTGNAGGSAITPPSVSTTNFVVREGRQSLDTLVSEMKNGILVSRFSGNVNSVSGDFSGVVKGGRLVRNGSVENAVKEVMVAGNMFEALRNLDGISKERKVIYSSILPYMRFGKVSFTAG